MDSTSKTWLKSLASEDLCSCNSLVVESRVLPKNDNDERSTDGRSETLIERRSPAKLNIVVFRNAIT